MVNPHLLQDLTDRGLWNPSVRNQLMRDSGSVANIDCIPQRLKDLYKTVWELKMKDIIDMAADRGKFVDQSQSLNLFIADPTTDKLTAMHFYAWQKGLKVSLNLDYCVWIACMTMNFFLSRVYHWVHLISSSCPSCPYDYFDSNYLLDWNVLFTYQTSS